jgi:CRISPR/Cas system-associated exonuclease Cas4 (RecB family)
MKIIRASEIGTFVYCKRAWWYAKQGIPSENKGTLTTGEAFHQKHGKSIRLLQRIKLLAYCFVLLAGLLMITYLFLLYY